MIEKLEFFVLGVKDFQGKTRIDVVRDEFSPFTLDGLPLFGVGELIDKDNQLVSFYGNIMQFPVWCVDHGFYCRIRKQAIEVEFPDMTTE